MSFYHELERECAELEAENARLSVALQATIAEKELYKAAFEEACHQFNFGDKADYDNMREGLLRLAKGAVSDGSI